MVNRRCSRPLFGLRTRGAEAIRSVRWLRSSHHLNVTDPTDEVRLLDWALEYNGYERVAAALELIFEVLRPLREAVQRDGVVPEWAGVDLLRAWAFWIARAYHWSGGYSPLREAHPELWIIVDAVNRHPAAKRSDRFEPQRRDHPTTG